MRRPLNNKFYLTDKELSARLKISRRTIQEWRYRGQISYFRIGGKMVFRESDIQAILEKGFRNSFR
ncbi:MAG: helix-turn-helix domain-containing protein [Bacteroidales bacterium]|nr:helix-turn-helix domain-containing protein [Bacteroidales bacterium]